MNEFIISELIAESNKPKNGKTRFSQLIEQIAVIELSGETSDTKKYRSGLVAAGGIILNLINELDDGGETIVEFYPEFIERHKSDKITHNLK